MAKRRPRDASQRAFNIVQEATGEEPKYDPAAEEEKKDPAAVALGRRGGKARAKTLTEKERIESARRAAKTRWKRK